MTPLQALVSRPLAGRHPIRGVVQLGHNLVFAQLSTEPAQHSIEALGQGAGLAAHRDGKRRGQVTGFQPAHRLAEPPESLGLTASDPHTGKDGERRDQERPASDQKCLVPALARDLGRRNTHHQRPPRGMDPDGPGDSRLTVLEHRLAGAASREEISVPGKAGDARHEKQRWLPCDDDPAVRDEGSRAAGREVPQDEKILDALQEEVQRQHPAQLPLARPDRCIDPHDDFRTGPRRGAHERIRGRGRPFEPLLIPDGQALALAE